MTRYPLEFMPINKKNFLQSNWYQVMKMVTAPHVFNYLNELLVGLLVKLHIVEYNELNLKGYSKRIKILQIQN